MNVPGYLTLLENAGTIDGWPKWVDDEGKKFAVEQITVGLQAYGRLDLAQRVIFDEHYSHRLTGKTRPECLKGVALWDARYAVAYRALNAARAKEVWLAESAVE